MIDGAKSLPFNWSRGLRLLTVLAERREGLLVAVLFVLVVVLGLTIPGFASIDNLVALVRSISVLSMLSIATAVVVIAGGIDLSVVAVMVATSGWLLKLVHEGVSPEIALLMAVGLALIIGLANGVMIAYFELPALLATLASSLFVIGVATLFLVRLNVIYVPPALQEYRAIGQGQVFGVPIPIVVLLAVALVAHAMLSRTRLGLFTYAQGDNLAAARLVGVPTRRLTVALFVFSSLVALIAGLVTAATAGGINLQITNGTMVFDVLLVAILGGVSLNGGEGQIGGVLLAALLIGVVLNAMTLMNINTIVQDIFKSLVLLSALVVDRFLHPTDLETARQGDL